MTRVFITDFDKDKYQLKELFALARPFLQPEKTKIDFSEMDVQTVSTIADADLILISVPLGHNYDRARYRELEQINQICQKNGATAYAMISGDYGKVHPQFSNIVYYRLGGFKTQLNGHNRAFYPILGDHLKRLFKVEDIVLREKGAKPVVGFCGHASSSIPKLVYEKLKLARVNGARIQVGDFNLEPLFSSAYQRKKILERLSQSDKVTTNFVLRQKYRAGAVTEEERHRTTVEYYENIMNSDYVVCLRGAGNFSVRLYETLLMGRVPVFINTDCLLPFENEIDWKKHVVWVEWRERKNIAEKIAEFHDQITETEFLNLQRKNRELWLTKMNIEAFLKDLICRNKNSRKTV